MYLYRFLLAPLSTFSGFWMLFLSLAAFRGGQVDGVAVATGVLSVVLGAYCFATSLSKAAWERMSQSKRAMIY